MKRSYSVEVSVDEKRISIRDSIETNFFQGEANQLAELCFRSMLALGYSPSVTGEAFAKVAGIAGVICHEGHQPCLADLND